MQLWSSIFLKPCNRIFILIVFTSGTLAPAWDIQEAKELLDAVIKLYNNERPHMSIGNLTPNQVHQYNLKTEKLWKNYYVKSPIIVNQ